MSDEAVVRIVLQEDQAAQREASQALLRGEAMPWAPPNQPIPPPAGMRSDQAEFLRLEAEAARAGLSVKEQRKRELAGESVVGTAAPAEVPTQTSQAVEQPPIPALDATPPPEVPTVDPHEERRKLNEERARERTERAAQAASTPAEPPTPAVVDTVKKAVEETARAIVEAAAEQAEAAIGAIPTVPLVPPASTPGLTPSEAKVMRGETTEKRLARLRANEAARIAEQQAAEAQPAFGAGGIVGPSSSEPIGTEPAFSTVSPAPSLPPPPPPPEELVGPPAPTRGERMLAAAREMPFAEQPPQEEGDGAGGGLLESLMGKGGMLGGALGAAGAAAIPVLAIKEMINQINSAVIGGIKSTVGAVASVGNFAANANADPSVQVEQFGRSVSAAGEQISSKLSPVLGWMTVAVGETTAALGGLMRGIDDVAKRYAEFSPEISQAQAIAEIRQTMGDLRRAREIGPELQKFLMAQSDLQQKFEDMKIKILAKILPIVTKMLEIMEAMPTQGIENAISAASAALQVYLAPLEAIAGLMYKKDFEEIEDPTDALFLPSTHADAMKTPQG